MLFLIEDNGYAISVPVEVNTPGGSISRLVKSFPNLFVGEVDGTDFLESYDALRYAAEYCRKRLGPALVHAHVVRPYSHSLSDDEANYRPKAERERELERDPVRRLSRFLLDEGILAAADLEKLHAEVDAEINDAADRALAARAAGAGVGVRVRLLAGRRSDVGRLLDRAGLRRGRAADHDGRPPERVPARTR